MPVAVDQHIHRRLKDAEGELFAAVLAQAGQTLDGGAQGVFLFTPGGRLLEFANTVSAGHTRQLLAAAMGKFNGLVESHPALPAHPPASPLPLPPEGGLVVAVSAKVLGGYQGSAPPRAAEFAASLGEDHLWIREDEARDLAKGVLPGGVTQRIARYHLVDNTRGEPPSWRPEEVRRLDLRLERGRLTGSVHLETATGDRGYAAALLGFVEATAGKVQRFDLIARGEFWGHGTFTTGAPEGKFPFAVSFRLIPPNCATDRTLPGAARLNLAGYLH